MFGFVDMPVYFDDGSDLRYVVRDRQGGVFSGGTLASMEAERDKEAALLPNAWQWYLLNKQRIDAATGASYPISSSAVVELEGYNRAFKGWWAFSRAFVDWNDVMKPSVKLIKIPEFGGQPEINNTVCFYNIPTAVSQGNPDEQSYREFRVVPREAGWYNSNPGSFSNDRIRLYGTTRPFESLLSAPGIMDINLLNQHVLQFPVNSLSLNIMELTYRWYGGMMIAESGGFAAVWIK
jgi:hypothetical protein